MSEITLNAKIRDYKGRSASNQARRDGYVPGIFYLKNTKNFPIEVKSLDLRSLVFTSETHIVNLVLDNGTSEKCLLRDVQFDPITDKVMHFDLMGLKMDELSVFEVPVVLEGQSIGVKNGGSVNQVLYKLEVECLPSDLPEHIVVDITNLDAGQQINVADLQLGSLTIKSDPQQSVVILSHARGESDGGAAAEGAEVEGEETAEEDSAS